MSEFKKIIRTALRKLYSTFYKIKSKAIGSKVKKVILSLIALFSVFALTAVIVLSYVTFHIITVKNGDPIINLEEYKDEQSRTSFVYAYDKDGQETVIQKLHGEENREIVNLDEISPYLVKAFVSLEDKRFYTHKGVDWVRFVGAMTKYNFTQGASTITQQLIKNLTGEKDVTVVRKFKEILTALNLENNYSKDVILESYLNTVALGNGCYGVKTAAETYFGKDVSELNLAESASMASITKAPFSFEPIRHFEANKVRQQECLRKMLEQGIISRDEYNEAIEYELILPNNPSFVPATKHETDKGANEEYNSFYVDFVIDNVIKDLMAKYGYSLQTATRKIYYGGLKIYAAVDMDVQKQMEEVFYNRITFPKQKDTPDNPAVQSAMTIMDYEGRVVGIIGQAGPKTGNRVLNRASDSLRQPGSTIKPLSVYAPAIDLNYINWSTKMLDYAFPYQGSSLWPRNVDRTYGSNTYVTVQKAIEKSINTIAARVVVDKLTPAKSFDYLQNKFHISTLDPKNDPLAAPMAVGAFTKGVSTLEMAAAYATFGNGGKYFKPYSYYKVTDYYGREVLLENKPEAEQVIAPDTSDIMCELLQTVETSYYGTGRNVRKFQIMCKTGTTDLHKDRWFCAGTPHYISATWYGYDKPKTINENLNPAGKIFIEVFDRISKGLPEKSFPKSGLTVRKSYCTSSGLLAGNACASTAMGWYKLNNLPGTCTTCAPSSIPDVIDDILDNILPNQSNNQPFTLPPIFRNDED